MPIFYEWWQSFYGAKASGFERCPDMFLDNNYLDKSFWEWEAKVGESLCWEWVVILQVQDTFQYKVCKQNYYVRKMF
jgi:hypothetical protein